MTTRVPCTECGAEILPATAQATGGLCMACKQGTRKNIEASKKYYEEQKKYDPYRALWVSLVNRVYKSDEGYDGLSQDEKLYYSVCTLDGEVYNGGFHQFFSNSSGEHYSDAVDGLLELGATTSLKHLTRAKALLFHDTDPSKDRMIRNADMKEYSENTSERQPWEIELDDIDRQFCDDPDNLGERLKKFADEKGILEPFKKEVEQDS